MYASIQWGYYEIFTYGWGEFFHSAGLVYALSWLYGLSGGEIELQEIVTGLIDTQMYDSPGLWIALISITVGIGSELSPVPFHQWTPDVYEGVWFVLQITNYYLYNKIEWDISLSFFLDVSISQNYAEKRKKRTVTPTSHSDQDINRFYRKKSFLQSFLSK